MPGEREAAAARRCRCRSVARSRDKRASSHRRRQGPQWPPGPTRARLRESVFGEASCGQSAVTGGGASVAPGVPCAPARRIEVTMSLSSTHRYTIISADCHAGASHDAYRDYLETRYLDDFDAWREKYRNPFSDLRGNRRLRNWDDELRNSQLEADGIVGEVIFPNTVPPFFPSFVLFARPPKPD